MRAVRQGLSETIDQILADAEGAERRRSAESKAIKAAEETPRTEVGRGLRALAQSLRSPAPALSYADLKGAP